MNLKETPKKVPPDHQSFNNFNLQQYQQKWEEEDSSIQDYNMNIEQSQFPEFNQRSEANPNNQTKIPEWDPKAMLSNLSFLEQKIHQLQELVHLIVGRRGQGPSRADELVAQQQQLVTADLTSIIVQLISTAGSLFTLFHLHIFFTFPPLNPSKFRHQNLSYLARGSLGMREQECARLSHVL